MERDSNSHKGQNGKVGVVGGSRDFTGAPALSAKASLRSGADLTKVLTSEQVRNTVSGYSENFIVDAYPTGYLEPSGLEKALKMIEWSDATVIGPGLNNPNPDTVEKIVSKAEMPLVIDADAIEPAINSDIGEAVFTPHRGELEIIKQKYGSAQSFAEEEDVVVVVTGSTDRIYSPEGKYENRTGHSTMTVGGTGDLLTGIIASLIAQDLSLEIAARKAAEINGKAGEKAAESYGNGALPTDMVENIPEALEEGFQE